jgi:hypothetical protein
LTNQWAINVINPRKWTREFDWGELGGLIVSNGYDYDLINDDVLQNRAVIANGNIEVQKMAYKLLIVPNVETIPVKTLEFIEKYVKLGGRVLFLERLPEKSTGLANASEMDIKVKEIVNRLFNEPEAQSASSANLYGIKEAKNDPTVGFPYGKGRVYRLNNVIDRQIWWNKQSSYLDPFLKILCSRIAPDFGIDFAQEGIRKNEGLTYIHRKIGDKELYFVANIQDKTSNIPVTFRVKNKIIRKWDPFTGKISEVTCFSVNNDGICLPLNMAPYESFFLEFAPGEPEKYVEQTDFRQINGIHGGSVEAETVTNGRFATTVHSSGQSKSYVSEVVGLPSPFVVSGSWQMELKGNEFPLYRKTTDHLTSWSENERTKTFSGTGRYNIDFTLPAEYLAKDQKIYLDLGKVGNIAEIRINGHETGIVWMRGQQSEVMQFLKTGTNHLEIQVTNTLINRIAAMKEPTPVPDYLVSRYGSKDISTEVPREFGFSPLPAAGLLGPVRLIPARKIEIKL